jgi:hypothetical protein
MGVCCIWVVLWPKNSCMEDRWIIVFKLTPLKLDISFRIVHLSHLKLRKQQCNQSQAHYHALTMLIQRPNIRSYMSSTSFNKRNPHSRPLPITLILRPKKPNKQLLLPLNPPLKKLPKHNRVPHKTNHIPTHQLRPYPPPEETEITRMSKNTVDTRCNECMCWGFSGSYDVREVCAGGEHGCCADGLAEDY